MAQISAMIEDVMALLSLEDRREAQDWWHLLPTSALSQPEAGVGTAERSPSLSPGL